MKSFFLLVIGIVVGCLGLLFIGGSNPVTQVEPMLVPYLSNTVIAHRGRVDMYIEVYRMPPDLEKDGLIQEFSKTVGDFDALEKVCSSHDMEMVWKGNFIEWLALNLRNGTYVIIGLDHSDAIALFAIEELERKAVWDITNLYATMYQKKEGGE